MHRVAANFGSLAARWRVCCGGTVTSRSHPTVATPNGASGNDDPENDVTEVTYRADEGSEKRGKWSSPTEFMLTCIGFSVGLGNVWRFPYLCYKNGGGAFLIAYMIMISIIGMPLLFLEFSFGQYFGVGSLTIFKKVCPLFQGVGIGYMIMNALVSVYYNVIIAMSLYYIFGSMTSQLPWSSCGNEWNTPNCGDPLTVLINDSAIGQCSQRNASTNYTSSDNTTHQRVSPTDEYFRYALMGEAEGINIENLGVVRWHLCLCLVLAWLLVTLFVSRGIRSTGKVAYFTATFPYIMLTVLVVRGATLPGASTGILYFITPDWKKLANPELWFHAATQLFYSTNLAWGGMITMASYNTFNHNCYRDGVVINIVCFATSVYAGIAVFFIIGYMANEYNVPVERVITSGPGLAFVAYPRALSLMPLAPMWTVLFFFMLFALGIGSQMVLIETVVTGFVDEFPRLGLNACVRFSTTLIICVLFLLSGIVMTTQGGMYVLQLLDHYSAGFGVLLIAMVESIAICWVYGVSKMANNVKEMLGYYPNIWWRSCWTVVTPFLILGILVFSLVRYRPAEYNGQLYPLWADLLGWVVSLSSNIPILVIAIYVLWRTPGRNIIERLRRACQPTTIQTNKRPSLTGIDINCHLTSSMTSLNDMKVDDNTEQRPLGVIVETSENV